MAWGDIVRDGLELGDWTDNLGYGALIEFTDHENFIRFRLQISQLSCPHTDTEKIGDKHIVLCRVNMRTEYRFVKNMGGAGWRVRKRGGGRSDRKPEGSERYGKVHNTPPAPHLE